MKTQILLYFLIVFSGCQLTVGDGENQYEIGLTEKEDEISIEEENKSIKQEMNLELIHLHEFNPDSIVISEISPFGELRRELGVFEVFEHKVLIPRELKLKGFYHFELIFTDRSIKIVTRNIKMNKNPKEDFHKKHKKHFPPKKPKYVLGPKDKKISDETMHLVLERGYLLAPSYDFVLKKFLHDAKHHFDDDGQRFFEDESLPLEDEDPFIEDPTYSDPLEEISDESEEEFND